MGLFAKKPDSGATDVTQAQVLDALRQIEDPDLGKDIVTLDFVKDLVIDKDRVAFRIELTTPACPVKEEFKRRAEELVRAIEGVAKVEVEMGAQVAASRGLPEKASVPGVRNVIAVSSGKGGVGKSTVAVNLAVALSQAGARVGILDADVYGPNVPLMLGVRGKPEIVDEKIRPFEAQGLTVMSMGFLVEEDQPVIWRGPMLHSAMKQFLFDVAWGELDYLVVDLPPGTGDAQLSLAQQAHLMGAVVVTTPQDVSVLDVKKAIRMFEQVQVPVLGVVENMSGLFLSGTIEGSGALAFDGLEDLSRVEVDGGRFSAEIDVFGRGGGAAISERFGVPLLGRIPLDPSVRVGGDGGKPVTAQAPKSPIAERFREIAGKLAARVSTVNLQPAG